MKKIRENKTGKKSKSKTKKDNIKIDENLKDENGNPISNKKIFEALQQFRQPLPTIEEEGNENQSNEEQTKTKPQTTEMGILIH